MTTPDDTTDPRPASMRRRVGFDTTPEPTAAPVTAEDLAQLFHDTYERLAPEHGYETRRDSAVPWEDVPAANKSLMTAVAGEVLERCRKAVEDAPAVADWTGMCVECREPIDHGDRITWRLRWSPQGPIHEECR